MLAPSTALSRYTLCGLIIFACLAATHYVQTATAAAVGKVTRVQKQAKVGARKAVAGSAVNMNDRLVTGAGARMQVRFIDGTELTLGENASVVINRYVFDPAKGSGKMALSSSRGAFRFATGKINQMKNKDVTVNTPQGALAVRGTEFWSGPIDGHYGTFLMKGKLDMRNRKRSVTLSPGQGVDSRRGRRSR